MSARIESKALVLSPSATHPLDYGNRNRVRQTTAFLQHLGYQIHFLLYPFESDWSERIPPSAKEMERTWDRVAYIPPSLKLHQPATGQHHEIDEWWDPQIENYLKWLFAREHFDVFLVNYTFLSKAFEFAPPSTLRIMDTHDLFSGRREMLEAAGAEPEFFYTTEDRERIAFDRADIVIAIKESEAEKLRTLTAKKVISVPFYADQVAPLAPEPRTAAEGELTVGFVGALNTVNTLNVQRVLDKWERYQRVYSPPVRILIAGNVCDRLHTSAAAVELLGRVENISDFYGRVDAVIAPLMFSTGIKIKVGEALGFGKPVVATRNAFDGFQSTDEYHSLPDMDAFCRALIHLSTDPARMEQLKKRTVVARQLARRQWELGYSRLRSAMRSSSKTILFVTDQQVWEGATVIAERTAQWCELCALMAKTILIYVGKEEPRRVARTGLNAVSVVDLHDRDNIEESVLEIEADAGRRGMILETAISLHEVELPTLAERVRPHSPTSIDLWSSLAFSGPRPVALENFDLVRSPADGAVAREESIQLSATTYRYLPLALNEWHAQAPSSTILAKCETETGQGDAAGLLQQELGARLPFSEVAFGRGPTDRLKADVAALKKYERPARILAYGQNHHAIAACESIASYIGAEFVELTDPPLVVVDVEGETRRFDSYAELFDHLAKPDRPRLASSMHISDTGWSQYWRMVTAAAA